MKGLHACPTQWKGVVVILPLPLHHVSDVCLGRAWKLFQFGFGKSHEADPQCPTESPHLHPHVRILPAVASEGICTKAFLGTRNLWCHKGKRMCDPRRSAPSLTRGGVQNPFCGCLQDGTFDSGSQSLYDGTPVSFSPCLGTFLSLSGFSHLLLVFLPLGT